MLNLISDDSNYNIKYVPVLLNYSSLIVTVVYKGMFRFK